MVLLDKNNYHTLVGSLNATPFNTYFARAVVEQKIDGKVYVDNTGTPQTFYILHPYGMSLLLGKSDNEVFNQQFREYIINADSPRDRDEWMQTFPHDWNPVLGALFRDDHHNLIPEVELDTRVNFKFNKEKYLDYKAGEQADVRIQIAPTTETVFETLQGAVIPANFWNSSAEFATNGVGYSLYYDNKLASVAFAAFIEKGALELGIETVDQFRGKGLAHKVCSALIDYCLEKDLEPIWACKLSNTGSFKLAHKLGFEVSRELPYYRLKYAAR
ncbi:GNAT family N-acetyltransferase [Chitinophaga sp. HK235]|uniref:GNAT family N-acetyltransferase n=1 Tax=Chitinophaga sp. HK235 TaxID=2952571 RepID=UPI001BA4DB79|nr:GNAT family N-acetyltransferase [Chitinophaga sp. HK235]